MRIFVKVIVALVAVVVVVAGAGLAYLYAAFPNVSAATAYKIDATPERLARGQYLNDHVVLCTTCHSERDWTRLSGPAKSGTAGRGGDAFPLGPMGTVYAKNITPAAIGSWTDGELLRAVTAGVSRDGTPLFPSMPYMHFGQMSEEDVHAVLAYTRSLEAIEGGAPDRTLAFPMNLIVRTIPAPAAFKPRPSPDNKAAYGKYMVDAALCSECHTPFDDQGQPIPGRDFAGGTEFVETGYRVRSANITPDADTGIGSWTEQQFIDRFKGFETPSDAPLGDAERRQNTVMPNTAYAGLTREDLSAMYAYLRNLKPIVNRVNKFPDAKGQ